ncbi:MAG: hypothetical protein AAGB24_08270 [Bacteroidota bacterium]
MGQYCDSEREKLKRWGNLQLPNRYKRVGIWACVLIFLLMVGKKFVDEPLWVKPLLSNALILFLLMISISKEKIEDELMVSLRSLSYRLAFVFGVLYAVIQPYIDHAVDFLINKDEHTVDTGYFQVLIFMLVVQLMFFHQLKRMS